MIRPLTIVTFLLASGSGLYLYQSKHEVQVLDRAIERTVHDTGTLREQSRLLAAEWTMLNDPERLRQFSDNYLNLKSIAPSQFTSLADLGSRLPAPQAEIPSNGTDEQEAVPVAGETGFEPVPEPVPVAIADEGLPTPPIPPVPAQVVASVAHPADAVAPDRRPVVADNQAHPVAPVADAHPSDQRPAEQHAAARVADARADARTSVAPSPRPVVLAAQRPWPANAPTGTPVNAPPASMPSRPALVAASGGAASGPYGGSLLGMARGSMPPPRPTPVSATYNSN